mmetsp:Transcript_73222/g.214657  ORF Transcript_73222/g.214657 Transcript_73222/m.214657 type:complete len:160 (+) Transcript_73222:812-1291(+)
MEPLRREPCGISAVGLCALALLGRMALGAGGCVAPFWLPRWCGRDAAMTSPIDGAGTSLTAPALLAPPPRGMLRWDLCEHADCGLCLLLPTLRAELADCGLRVRGSAPRPRTSPEIGPALSHMARCRRAPAAPPLPRRSGRLRAWPPSARPRPGAQPSP